MGRIKRRGVLRVGVDVDELPFAYFNQQYELVGFDIEMAQQMARDLDVDVEFVKIERDVIQELTADHFDIAVGGIEGTVKRAASLASASSYLDTPAAIVVRDHEKRRFLSSWRLLDTPGVRVAVVTDSRAAELLRDALTHTTIIELDSERDFFTPSEPPADALVTTAEVGSAWTLVHPRFTVIRPSDLTAVIPLYYFAPQNSNLEDFLSTWQSLKQRDGTREALYNYWILGEDPPEQKRRWCVVRDVLHWVP